MWPSTWSLTAFDTRSSNMTQFGLSAVADSADKCCWTSFCAHLYFQVHTSSPRHWYLHWRRLKTHEWWVEFQLNKTLIMSKMMTHRFVLDTQRCFYCQADSHCACKPLCCIKSKNKYLLLPPPRSRCRQAACSPRSWTWMTSSLRRGRLTAPWPTLRTR